MPTNKVQTGLRLNPIIYEKIKVIAVKEQRSLNNLMEYVIQRYIEDYEIRNGSIQISEEY